MLTGKYDDPLTESRGNNDDLPDAETTMAEALKPRGYATALFGKWHHGAPPERGRRPTSTRWIRVSTSSSASPTPPTPGNSSRPSSGKAGPRRPSPATPMTSSPTAPSTSSNGIARRPFFLYLPYIATHFHIEAPADEVELHRGKFPEVDPAVPLRATYAAMVTRLDKQRRPGPQDARTTSGWTATRSSSSPATTARPSSPATRASATSTTRNRPFRGQKRTLWEGGIRVPGRRPPGPAMSRPDVVSE